MKTNIEYADEVSNSLMARPKGDESVKIGTFCEKPDAKGTCLNCWAESWNLRFGNKPAFDKSNRDKIEWKLRRDELSRLIKLNKKCPKSVKFPGLPLVVFCCDTFDVFQPSITDELRNEIFDVYDGLHYLTLLIQTTYPARMNRYFNERYGAFGVPSHYRIGMSCGTQEWFDKYVHFLTGIKARFRYIIFEPLLENILCDAFTVYDDQTGEILVHQFIVGGESGAKPRGMSLEWARNLKLQAESVGIAFFMKQESKLGNKNYKKFEAFPEDLQIRQYPAPAPERGLQTI